MISKDGCPVVLNFPLTAQFPSHRYPNTLPLQALRMVRSRISVYSFTTKRHVHYVASSCLKTLLLRTAGWTKSGPWAHSWTRRSNESKNWQGHRTGQTRGDCQPKQCSLSSVILLGVSNQENTGAAIAPVSIEKAVIGGAGTGAWSYALLSSLVHP